jgi:hypothetical protein
MASIRPYDDGCAARALCLVGEGWAFPGSHAASTSPALGAPLLRVARIQSSATVVFRMNAAANDNTESAVICGHEELQRAGA